MDRKLALVTGASAGIGTAFARIYASHGYDVALTARRGERLEVLAEEIRYRYGVETLCVVADLADVEAPGQILDHLTDHGRSVDVLVNNAGYGLTGTYAETSWNEYRINNINQHFITAFLGIHLKNKDYGKYLEINQNSNEKNWTGFKPRQSTGLELLHAAPAK